MGPRVLLLLSFLIPVCASAGEDEDLAVPFFLPTPEGWRTETIPFPLGFAPELSYEGLEELRFAPGMFEEGSEEFWSYAFVWWIPDDTVIDADRLATDLEAYFAGLTRAVGEDRGLDVSGASFELRIDARDSHDDSGPDYVGTAKVFDPFVTAAAVTLNVRVHRTICSDQHRLAVFFELSPQPDDHPIWSTLAEIRGRFRCRE